ncbi:MAG TPA: hypothetical protein VHC94_01655 [Nitrobacter sp.]|jgi:hypothetical protein|nr:hypothetical protein [Nitrobacter sp.]
MSLRTLLLLAAMAAMAWRVVAAPMRAPDRHVLHHCEDVLTHAVKTTQSARTHRTDAAEVERCRIVVREFALRDSRMSVDENGKMMR